MTDDNTPWRENVQPYVEKFANVRDAYGNIYLLCHGFDQQEIDFLKQAMDEIDRRREK